MSIHRGKYANTADLPSGTLDVPACVLTWWMFKFMNKVLNGVDRLNLCFRLMVDNGIENGHSLSCDVLLNLLLWLTVDQTRLQIGQHDLADVELILVIHVL